MGEVFLAEQSEPIRRRVAVKLIKAGLDTREVVARFQAERQALALMEHSGIARVYEAGISDHGRPWFAMELVTGIPITAFCDLHRLGPSERIQLFVQVCEAVQHAHQKGIIHRDLKPSNVLVSIEDGSPRPKIIDFGIAKAVGGQLTERTLVTHQGQLMGTVEYMSPEQAEMSGLGVDTLTDVYSLGVILYELLAGALPFDPGELRGMKALMTLRETEPPRPSTRFQRLPGNQLRIAEQRGLEPAALRRRLTGDLDWIVMKAIAKDRTRRYETAHALAQDCRAFLAHQPVSAGPPSAAYRLSKFARRHSAGVAAGAIAVMGLVGSSLLASVGMVRAQRAEQRTQMEAEAARQVSDFLVDLFEVSDPGEARGNEVTARELLERGAERIRSRLAGQPLTKARLLGTIAEVYYSLGLMQPAAELGKEALDIREVALGPEHPETAASLLTLGKTRWRSGDYAEARLLLERATSALERADPGEDRRLAEAVYLLAVLDDTEGRPAQAEPSFLRALELWERSGDPDSIGMAAAHNGLGVSYLNQARFADARAHLEKAIELKERLRGADHPSLLGSIVNLGVAHYQQKEHGQAERLLRRALALSEQVYGPGHPDEADVLLNLGSVLEEQGAPLEDIEPLYLRAVTIWEKAIGPDSPDIGYGMTNLGSLYRDRGRFEDAERAFLDADRIWRSSLGPDHFLVGANLAGLAMLRYEQNRTSEAESLFQRAIGILERSLPPEHPYLQEPVEAYADMLRSLGREAEAEAVEVRAARGTS